MPKDTPDLTGGGNSRTAAAGQLKAFIERVERIEHDERALKDDKKEVYAEAKANGFDTKIMRKTVAIRRRSLQEVREEQDLLDIYMHALGMVPADDDDEPEAEDEDDEDDVL